MTPTVRQTLLLASSILAMLVPLQGADPNGHDWWSLRPLARPAVPELSAGDASKARTPIDHFILAKLRAEGLAMSPEADRRTLIRRLYFDLIGLPPSPEEVASFIADEDAGAYGDLVEKLLASPRYGERWARHWLDVVHYADTHGYDKDQPRPNAWPYRDYVVRAFNEDRPYERFVHEQLAGDVLYPGSTDGIVATGFIAAGPWDLIGHAEVPEEKIDGQVARHLDRDDMSMTTMNTFTSLTVQCAQCHDHKRDPVSMEEYYGLQAVFAAVDRADRPYDADPEVARRRASLLAEKAELDSRLAKINTEINEMKPPALLALEQEIAAVEDSLNVSKPVDTGKTTGALGYHSEVASSQDTEKWVQVDLGRSMPIDNLLIFGAGEYGFADFGFPERFRIEASDDERFATGVQVVTDATGANFPRPGASPARFSGKGITARHVRITATKLWNRHVRGEPETGDWIFALGEFVVLSEGNVVPVAAVHALDSIEAAPRWAKANLTDGIYGVHGSLADQAESSLIDRFPLADADPAGRHARLASLARAREKALAESIPPLLLTKRHVVTAALLETILALKALPSPSRVYAGTVHTGSGNFKGTGASGGRPRPIHVLARGDVRRPLEEAPPSVPAIIPGAPSVLALPEGHSEGDRRVALAKWITRKDNPLTWRSIVNRIWLYHFGNGIVDSPNDFGRMGQLPTHPELLDWLAVEFRDSGQSIKDLHRLMVTSAVYRQSSLGNPQAETTDAGNRFLWRMNRRKIEAEALRDGMLLVAGVLDPAMFGPGFQDFVIEKPEHSPHYKYRLFDVTDPTSYRRSIYRFIVRSQPQPFLNTLDCADPALLVDKRNETLTALQALALFNNRFAIHMAERFAIRLEGKASTLAAQVERGYALALGRAPSAEETEAMVAYGLKHGLPAVCRLIFNLNEFAFIE